jgi:hypothetical protein
VLLALRLVLGRLQQCVRGTAALRVVRTHTACATKPCATPNMQAAASSQQQQPAAMVPALRTACAAVRLSCAHGLRLGGSGTRCFQSATTHAGRFLLALMGRAAAGAVVCPLACWWRLLGRAAAAACFWGVAGARGAGGDRLLLRADVPTCSRLPGRCMVALAVCLPAGGGVSAVCCLGTASHQRAIGLLCVGVVTWL